MRIAPEGSSALLVLFVAHDETLGLSIVQQIVLQYGGEILAGRAPAGGARLHSQEAVA